MLLRFLLAATLAAGLAGCPDSRREEKPDVIVLHTGRMRGNVCPPGMKGPLQHYQYIAGYVNAVRAEAAKTGAKVILLDLGDSLSGSFAAHATDSENVAAFFNALNYDAIALSNLDSAVPAATLSKIHAKVLTPFAAPDGKPAPPEAAFSAKFDAGGLPVAAMANFYGDANPRKFPGRFPSTFADTAGVVPVREYNRENSAGAGGLTLLTWMKLEDPSTPPTGFLSQLREAGIQAIAAHRVYGATEREVWESSGFAAWDPPASINILRNNGGFVLARLDLKRDQTGWRAIRQELVPMTANSATADSSVPREIARFAETISAKDAHVTTLPAPVEPPGILRACLAALTTIPGTGAALYSPQAIRTDWPAGELRASTVFDALPWTSPVVQVSLPAENLARAAAELDLAGAVPESPASGPVTVSTSAFFASQLAERFGGGPAREVAPSEFDWFVSRLKEDPGLLNGLPPGWKEMPPVE